MPDPTPPDPKVAEDALVERIARAAAEGTAAAFATRDAAPAPAAPATDPTDALAGEFETLCAQGQYGEALKLVSQRSYGPLQAAQMHSLKMQGKQNIARLRDREEGIKPGRFKSREAKFRAKMSELRANEEMCSDPEIVEHIWRLTCAEDETFIEELATDRANKMRDTERAEEAERIKREIPPPLAPIISTLPAEDRYKKLAEEHLSEDPRERDWELRQLSRYGITLDSYLRQAAKVDDPESNERVGVGRRAINLWTEIGGKSRNVPKPKEA